MPKVIYRVVGPNGADFRVRDNDGVVEVSYDGGTNWITATEYNNTLSGSNSYVKVTDATTYDVLAANSGKLHIMPDLTADSVLSLPTVENGLRYKFVYFGGAADAQDWQFDTGSDTNFYIGGVIAHDTDAGGAQNASFYSDGDSNSKLNVLTPAAGTEIDLICDGTNWYLTGTVHSATDTPVTFADQ